MWWQSWNRKCKSHKLWSNIDNVKLRKSQSSKWYTRHNLFYVQKTVSSGSAPPGCARANSLAEIPPPSLPPWQSKVVIIQSHIKTYWLPLLKRLMTYLCPAVSGGLALPLTGEPGWKYQPTWTVPRIFNIISSHRCRKERVLCLRRRTVVPNFRERVGQSEEIITRECHLCWTIQGVKG